MFKYRIKILSQNLNTELYYFVFFCCFFIFKQGYVCFGNDILYFIISRKYILL